jgi:hypothetical protein
MHHSALGEELRNLLIETEDQAFRLRRVITRLKLDGRPTTEVEEALRMMQTTADLVRRQLKQH